MQHAQVKGPDFVLFFHHLDFSSAGALYEGSPGMYRRRWDAMLKALMIESAHGLPPGALRGGGEALNEVQWRMHLKHQATLGYYLQEVAALSILPALSSSSRNKVRGAAAFLPSALQTLPARSWQAVSASGGGAAAEKVSATLRPAWLKTFPTASSEC